MNDRRALAPLKLKRKLNTFQQTGLNLNIYKTMSTIDAHKICEKNGDSYLQAYDFSQ